MIDVFVDSSDLSRSNSNASNVNDRLQERLARAMAKKNASRTESPAPGLQPAADVTSNGSAPETDIEVKEDHVADARHTDTTADSRIQELEAEQARQCPKPAENEPTLATPDGIAQPNQQIPKIDISVQDDASSTRTSTDALMASQPLSARASQDLPRKSEESLVQTAGTTELREEISTYIEKIDALQSKLQYLSKEAARSAAQAAASAQPGSLEKKILEKDEKIALLMEEGQKLSKTEMKHLSTIKKMRAQITATYKEQEAAKLRADKAERFMKDMEDRAKKAEAASKRAEQCLAASTTGSSDLEAVRKERDALQTTLADMRSQISKANARAEAAESKAQADQLAKERKRNAELQDDLTSAKIEREISEEKLRREIKDLQAILEREKEQTKAMESEMLSEQASLESKLEYFRVRAEEASSADHGHV